MKNYLIVLLSTYLIIIITKFIFIFYLNDQFSDFDFLQLTKSVFWGYKFDLAASSVIAFVATLFDWNKKLFALLSSTLIVSIFLIQIGDILYFYDSNRHIGYEIIDTFNEANSLFMTAYSQHKIITLLSMFMAVILLFIFNEILKKSSSTSFNRLYILKKLLIIVLTVFFVRGMIQHIPLHPWQANEIGNPQLATVAQNAIYNIVYSLANKKKKLEASKLPEVEQIDVSRTFKELYSSKPTISSSIKNRPNVVLLFSEGWSAKFMNSYGYKEVTTPVYDALLTQSIRPKFMLAGGHRTTEGIFSSLTSYQNPLGKSIAKTQLQNFKYDSMIYLFNENNYSSAFFQGSAKDTSGTGSLVNYLGFEYSFGKRDIKKRLYEENYWGVQDGDLYNFIQKKLQEDLKEPFIIGINGASTHDSVTPKGYPKKHFSDDEKINNKLNALHYSDFALGQFIEEMEKTYPNTIFVLFADHCTGLVKGTMENYMIPFAIYSKQLIKPQYYDVVLSQRDIAPTLIDLVFGQYRNHSLSFTGKSLFSDSKFFADYFQNGILGWIEENNIVEINITNNELKCFKLTENLTKSNVTCIDEFKEMHRRGLSFTNISQQLLFEGKTKEFSNLRIDYE